MRRGAAQLYDRLLKDLDAVRTPIASEEASHVYHLYVIQQPHRDTLMSYLRARGVSANLHYPVPVHLQPCYEHLGIRRDSLPVTESLAKLVLSLPMYPEITEAQVQYVCAQIQQFCSAG